MSQLKDSSQPTGSGLAPFFTVFTATYNRAHTLHRAFDSLCAQSFRDFEWLVVDDGSTDDTANLIDKWIKTANFPIRYFRQPNSGKHIAHNLAIREARGQFFTVIDSDDALMPAALERAHNLWHEIPETERYKFCGAGLRSAGLFPLNKRSRILHERYGNRTKLEVNVPLSNIPARHDFQRRSWVPK
jgi:glycosyltransferase involved in cell wall biosynthesis